VEPSEAVGSGVRPLAEKERRDEESTQHEEHAHAEESTLRESELRVEGHHSQDRQRSDAVERRPVSDRGRRSARSIARRRRGLVAALASTVRGGFAQVWYASDWL